MNSNTFQSATLNEIYNSVFDEINEEFLTDRYDEDFDYEAWLEDQVLWKTNSEGNGEEYQYLLTPLRTAEVMELLGEINQELVEITGDNLAMEFDIPSLAKWAVWAVGNRLNTNNSNPLDNEFSRLNPADPPNDEE